MGHGRRRLQTLITIGVCAPAIVACSILSDLDGYAGGASSDAATAPPDVGIVTRPDGGACACLATPPGWQGPAGITSGPDAAPPCSGDYSAGVLEAFTDPDAPPAACGCTCDTTNVTCPSSFMVDVFGSSTCGGSKCGSVSLSPGACVDMPTMCFFANGIGPAPSPEGACTPKATATTVPTWSWKTASRVCVLPELPQRGSCPADTVCAPLPDATMGLRPCVFMEGDLACPAGPYSVKRLVYGDAIDTRACGECACGSPTGTCAANVREGCSSATPKALPACMRMEDPAKIQMVSAPTPTDIACAATGGDPTGSVTPTKPTTLCCLP